MLERLIDILKHQTGHTEIDENTRFIEDLNLDSLDMVEIVMEVEEEFDIDVYDGEVDNLKTVGEAIAFIEKKLQ